MPTCLRPGPGPRDTPVRGVLLTDAEFDHTIGLLILREGSPLTIYATAPVLDTLANDFPVRGLLSHYADLSWREVATDVSFALGQRLRVTAVATGRKPPRYVREPNPSDDCFSFNRTKLSLPTRRKPLAQEETGFGISDRIGR